MAPKRERIKEKKGVMALEAVFFNINFAGLTQGNGGPTTFMILPKSMENMGS